MLYENEQYGFYKMMKGKNFSEDLIAALFKEI